jgi:hypothetical protein
MEKEKSKLFDGEGLFRKVSELVSNKNYTQAKNILGGLEGSRDPYVQRAWYVYYKSTDNAERSDVKATKALNFLESIGDTFGVTEKAICLLYGKYFKQNTYQAETLLLKTYKKDERAKYYLAQIHSKGLHVFQKERVKDLDYALRLYKSIIDSGKNELYKVLSEYEYVNILFSDGNGMEVHNEDKVEIYRILLKNSSKTNPIKRNDFLWLFCQFLSKEMKFVVDSTYEENDGMSVAIKIKNTKDKTHALNSLNELIRNIRNTSE